MGLGKTYSTKYLLDSNNSSGVAGQVLSTTSTGIDWVDANTVPGSGLWLANGNDIYNSNSGNVGIGTTSPITKLHVSGSTGAASGIRQSRTGVRIWKQEIDSSGRLIWGYLSSESGSTTQTFTLDDNGNVGIGTTSPQQLLDVNTNSTGLNVDNTAAIFGNDIGTTQSRDTWVKMRASSQTTDRSWAFGTQQSGDFRFNYLGDRTITPTNAAASTLLTIKNTGNVGIGTTSPVDGNLQVTKTGMSTGITNVLMNASFADGSNGTGLTIGYRTDETTAVLAPRTATGNLAFYNYDGSWSESMRIKNNGNVGIGTTNPLDRLHVDGARSNFNGIKIGENGNKIQFAGVDGNISVGNNNWLIFSEGATEFMRSGGSSGNVGIGTTSPGSKLTVNGSFSADTGSFSNELTLSSNLRLQNNITILNKAQSAYISFATRNTTGSEVVMDLTNVGSINGGAAGPYLPLSAGSSYPLTGNLFINNGFTLSWGADTTKIAGSSSTNELSLITASTTRMRIDQVGNVGIGTTNPSSRLEIKATSATHKLVSINRPSSDTAALYIGNDSASPSNGIISSNHSDLIFGKDQSGTLSEWMRIKRDGNVGIGNTNPLAKLQITNGDSGASSPWSNADELVLESSGNAGLAFQTPNTGAATIAFQDPESVQAGFIQYLHADNALRFATNGNNERMRIESTGVVKFPNTATSTGDVGTIAHYTNNYMYIRGGTSGLAIGDDGFDTSIYLNNSDSIQFQTGGTERMRINSQGQMWLGGSYTGSNIANGSTGYMNNLNAGSFSILHRNSSDAYVHFNSYYTSSNTYVSKYNGRGFMLGYNAAADTGFFFSKAPSTAAGQTQTFSQVMTVGHGTSNNVGIGTTSPQVKLHVAGRIRSTYDGNTASYSGNYVRLFNSQEFNFLNSSGASIASINLSGNSYFNGGNVGIGVTDPEKKLEVKSDTTYDGIMLDVLSNPEITFRDRGNSDTLVGTGRHALDGFHIDTYSGNAFFIKGSNRYVGIGTTSPSAKLEVRGTAATYTNASTVFWGGTTNNDNHNGITLSSLGDALGGSLASNLLYSNSNTPTQTNTNRSSGQIKFENTTIASKTSYINFGGYYKGTTTFIERMRIDSDGNVGIGTTSPGYKLEVSDANTYVGIKNTLAGSTASPSWSGLTFAQSSGAVGASIQSGDQLNSNSNNDLRFLTRATGGGSASEIVRFTGGGNVGIGTTSPGSKLQVAGEIRVADGAKGAPSYSFTSDTNTGMFSDTADVLEFTVGGDTNLQIRSGYLDITQYIRHIGDADTYFGFTAANQFQVIAGGNTNLNVQGNGVDLSYAGSTRLTTQTGGIAITGDLTVTTDVGIGLTNPDVPLHVTANEDGSGIDKGAAKFINTNTGQGATTMHMVQTSSSNFANAVKFWQGSTPTAVGFIRLTTSATQFITSASDLNLKKNITNWSDDTLSKFKALEPKKFRFKTQDVSEDKTLGFIAQNEVDNFPEAYPQFLGDNEQSYYGFNPTGMVPHLMKAIKDLVEKVETLENRITQLENNN